MFRQQAYLPTLFYTLDIHNYFPDIQLFAADTPRTVLLHLCITFFQKIASRDLKNDRSFSPHGLDFGIKKQTLSQKFPLTNTSANSTLSPLNINLI